MKESLWHGATEKDTIKHSKEWKKKTWKGNTNISLKGKKTNNMIIKRNVFFLEWNDRVMVTKNILFIFIFNISSAILNVYALHAYSDCTQLTW